MQLVKLHRHVNSKVEQAKVIASTFCLLSSIKLSDTDMTVLSYFMVYKITQGTKDLIFKSRILKNPGSIKNTMSRLKSVGLIRKSVANEDGKREYILNDSLNINLDSIIALLIKVDNK